MNNQQYLNTAKTAAQAGQRILKKYFRAPLTITVKDEQHYNIVTQADVECEEAIVECLQEVYPDHNILAEEHEYGKTGSPYTWIIDPLDGTTNFAHGIPAYSISIALAFHDDMVAGLVWDIEHNEMYTAVKGSGAWCNDVRLSVSSARTLPQCLFSTGFYYGRGEEMKKALKKIEQLLTLGIIDIRRFGSAALDLCMVASGRIDGYFEYMLNPWDFAAGKLIVEEAGGLVTDCEGENPGISPSYIVGTNGKIHGELLEILQ
ncbi:MAG: inositol monophosphatase [Spirochaetales bacterium]|nr:inositol monophosphatase [Spirochaetales bacterium]